jgi:hypothetical protein
MSNANSQSHFDKLEKEEFKQHKTVYWLYAYGDFDKTFAQEKVSKLYGFSFKQVAGCTVTNEIIGSISRHNKAVDKILAKRISTDWKLKIFGEIDSVFRIDTTLINHFYIDTVLIRRLTKMADEIKEHYEFRVAPTENPGIFLINAFIIDKNWLITDKSILTIEATFPEITYRIVEQKYQMPATLVNR